MQHMYILTGLMFLFLGMAFYIKVSKTYSLLGGYMTMSEKRRRNIDWQGLANLFFYTMLIASFCSIINSFFFLIHKNINLFVWIWTGIISISALLCAISRTIKFDYSKKGGLPPELKTEIKPINKKLFWGIFISIVILSFVPFWFLRQPPDIKLENKTLHINSFWGGEYKVSDIQKIDTLQKLPKIIVRTNGYALFKILKGNFELDSLGNSKLFLVCGSLPYIYIETKDNQKVIFNQVNADTTRAIFKELNNQKSK